MTETGADAMTTTLTGNSANGNYTQTQNGTDTYTITEAGTISSGAYSLTLTGVDTVTATTTGNTIQGTFVETVIGGGTYTRAETGGTLGSGSGTNNYTVIETGNSVSGQTSQTETGKDRFGLIEQFANMASTVGAGTPGHLLYQSFGSAFAGQSAMYTSSDCTPAPRVREEKKEKTQIEKDLEQAAKSALLDLWDYIVDPTGWDAIPEKNAILSAFLDVLEDYRANNGDIAKTIDSINGRIAYIQWLLDNDVTPGGLTDEELQYYMNLRAALEDILFKFFILPQILPLLPLALNPSSPSTNDTAILLVGANDSSEDTQCTLIQRFWVYD